MAQHPNSLANLRPPWAEGQTGNPDGKGYEERDRKLADRRRADDYWRDALDREIEIDVGPDGEKVKLSQLQYIIEAFIHRCVIAPSKDALELLFRRELPPVVPIALDYPEASVDALNDAFDRFIQSRRKGQVPADTNGGASQSGSDGAG